MYTAFQYCRVGVQRLMEVIYAIIFTGGFVAGPRTLRPERLQGLTTSAANKLAFMRTNLWSLGVGLLAQAAPNRSIHRVDSVPSARAPKFNTLAKQRAPYLTARCGASSASSGRSALSTYKRCVSSPGFSPVFPYNCDRARSLARDFASCFFKTGKQGHLAMSSAFLILRLACHEANKGRVASEIKIYLPSIVPFFYTKSQIVKFFCSLKFSKIDYFCHFDSR